MSDFIGYYRKLSTSKLHVKNNLTIGNQSVIAGTGYTWYVDSGASNASNSNTGKSWAQPLATLDAAIGKCTANRGDIILIAEGHSETYTTTGTKVTFDVAGVEIIGLGNGANKPTFNFGYTTATMVMSAASVKLSNVKFVTSIDQVVTYLTVSGNDCEIDIETQDVTDKEVISDITVTGDRCKVNIRKFGYVDGNANARVVSLNSADNAEINIYALTKVTTGIVNFVSNASVGVKIKGMFYVKGTTDLTKNVVDTVGSSVFYIEGFDMGAGASFSGNTATPAVDDVGAVASALATVDGIVDSILVDTGTTLPATLTSMSGATFDTSTDSLEAISNKTALDSTVAKEATVAALNNISTANVNTEVDNALNTIVPASPTAGSINDILSKAAGGNTFDKSTDSLEALADALVVVDGVADAIKAVTDYETLIATKSISTVAINNTNLFNLVGEIEIESIVGIVTTATEDAACTYKFDFYDGTTNTDLCTTTSIQNKGIGTILAIDGTFGNALAVTAGNVSQGQSRKIVLSDGGGTGNGKIRGVASAAITGVITFIAKYKKISSDGALSASA